MHISTSVVTWSASPLGWHAHGDQEMALQHSSQPQTNGDYWCCYHGGQHGIKKVREINILSVQTRPGVEQRKRGIAFQLMHVLVKSRNLELFSAECSVSCHSWLSAAHLLLVSKAPGISYSPWKPWLGSVAWKKVWMLWCIDCRSGFDGWLSNLMCPLCVC